MTEWLQEEIRLEYTEKIILQEGYLGLNRGYFCKVSQKETCVEAFGATKRQALRLARRAWYKETEKKRQIKIGYPRVMECED